MYKLIEKPKEKGKFYKNRVEFPQLILNLIKKYIILKSWVCKQKGRGYCIFYIHKMYIGNSKKDKEKL